MTPPPIWPTPTAYPTPVATSSLAELSITQFDVAEGLVQGYQSAMSINEAGNIVQVVLLVVLAVGGLWSIIKRMQRED